MAKRKVTQIKRTAPKEIAPAVPALGERAEQIEVRVDVPPWPTGLPVDAGKFWSAGAEFSSLGELPALDEKPALKRLGPLPFPRSGFPLMGFLATLYEHVVGHLSRPSPPLSKHERQQKAHEQA